MKQVNKPSDHRIDYYYERLSHGNTSRWSASTLLVEGTVRVFGFCHHTTGCGHVGMSNRQGASVVGIVVVLLVSSRLARISLSARRTVAYRYICEQNLR